MDKPAPITNFNQLLDEVEFYKNQMWRRENERFSV
jgi:hypothetical protein